MKESDKTRHFIEKALLAAKLVQTEPTVITSQGVLVLCPFMYCFHKYHVRHPGNTC